MSGTTANYTTQVRLTGDASGLQRAGGAAEVVLKRVDGAAKASGQGLTALGAGGRAAEAALGSLSSKTGALGTGLASLGTGGLAAAAAMAAVATSAGAIAVAGDAMTKSLATLRSATGNVEAARGVFEQLYRLALQTGAGVDDLVGSFARFSVAANGIGATNDQVVKLVQLIQQAGAVAGVSAQEANGAAVQLAQGLSTGKLAWEELKPIMEQMPTLAAGLARELGVSTGQLREMASAGELAATRVMPALLRLSEGVRREFEQLPPTMERGLGALQVATTRFLADLDKALGISGALARNFERLASIIERARGGFFPTPEMAAQAGVASAMARIAEIDRQLALFDPQPGVQAQRSRQGLRPGLQGSAAAQVGADQAAELRQRRAEAVAEAQRHAQELERVQAEHLDRQAGDATAAAARATQTQREADTRAQRALEESLDARRKAQGEYTRDMQELRERLNRGAIDQATFDRTAAELRERLAQADRDAAKAARESARESEQAATKRGRVVQSLQVEEEARRRELATLRLGTEAREQLATELEIEKQLREAGIPAIEQRTAAEQASAEAIERSVRATAALRAEISRQDDTAREARRAAERALQEIATTSARISEDAAEAIFDSLTGERRGQSVLDWFKTLFKRIAVQALSANIFLPITTAIVGSVPGLFGISMPGGAAGGAAAAAGGAGGLGGLGSLLSLGGSLNSLTGGGLMNSLGLGGIGSTISGWMSAPLWGGTSGLSAAALSGPGGLAALEAAGGAAGGFIAPSLASLLGPAALGAAGGGLLASLTGGNPIGGSIGGGLGAVAGFMLGGPVGALIGGAAGGGLGSLFGNSGPGFSGGDALVGRDNAGGLVFSGFAGKGFDGSALTQQAQQEIAAFNQRLAAAGVFVNSGMRASIGGGQSTAPRTLTGALDAYGFGLGSNDPRIAAAIAPYAGNIEGALAVAEEAKAVAAALDALKTPAATFAASMKALDDQFRPLWESTVKLGFGTDDLVAAWTKAQQDLTTQRDRTMLGLREGLRIRSLRAEGRDEEAALAEFDFRVVDELRQFEDQLKGLGLEAGVAAGLLDNLRTVQAQERAEMVAGARAMGGTLASLGQDISAWMQRMRTTPAGGLSAQEQLVNARAAFDDTLALANLNDTAALRSLTGTADNYFAAYRAVNGSAGFGRVHDWVLDSIASLDAVTQARLPAPTAGSTVTMTADPALLAENAALRQQIAAMRDALEANTESHERLRYALPPVVVGARG